MIALLALLLQTAAAAPIQVRAGAEAVPLAVAATSGRPMVDAARLASALDGSLRTLPTGWMMMSVRGVDLEVAPGVRFARLGTAVYPLAAEPTLVNGRLMLPVQVATELLPRLVGSLEFDGRQRELAVIGNGGGSVASASGTLESTPAAPSASPPRNRPEPTRDRQRTVVVDAGHGGKDPGTNGLAGRHRIYEKDIALAVARALRDSLTKRGVRVVLTRDDDTLVPLYDRGPIANRQRGDLFLSIHVNAANPRARDRALVRGFETYFLSEAKTEDAKRVEEMENGVVRFETEAEAPKDDPLSFIITDMAQNEHLRESSDLADVVQRHLGGIHPGPNRGVKQANFAVLRTSFMPAVLIEIGFATNAQEAAWIASTQRQRQIAGAIAEATMEYLEHYERRIGGSHR